MSRDEGMRDAEALRERAFDTLARARDGFRQGRPDLSGLEESVRDYCDAIARLPKEEGQRHAPDLERLMEDIGALGKELTTARDAVKRELSGLERVQHANVAYKKSDAMMPFKPRPKEEEDE